MKKNCESMTDLTAAKRIIDEAIAKHNADVNSIFTAAQAKPAEQRMGFVVEALDEAQRGSDADAALCDEIITAATTLKNLSSNKTASMRDALNNVVYERCREIEEEYATTVCSSVLTRRSNGSNVRRWTRSTTSSRSSGAAVQVKWSQR